jgi:hypothetical protein
VNAYLPDGIEVAEAELSTGIPIAKALERWLEPKGLSLGHVAIAYGLIGRPKDIVFAPGAQAALVRLHEKFMRAFSASASA